MPLTKCALSKLWDRKEQKRIPKASDQERLVWANRKLRDGHGPIVSSTKGEVAVVGRSAGSGEPEPDSSVVDGSVICGAGGPAEAS